MTEDEALWDALMADPRYKKQALRLMEKFGGDIDPMMLGTMWQYKYISMIIPLDRVVYDIGCAYAFQAYYFTEHKSYVGVDCVRLRDRLRTPNSRHVNMAAGEFLSSEAIYPIHFAICTYVPPWYGENAEKLVRDAFDHMFVFYPRMPDSPRPSIRI